MDLYILDKEEKRLCRKYKASDIEKVLYIQAKILRSKRYENVKIPS